MQWRHAYRVVFDPTPSASPFGPWRVELETGAVFRASEVVIEGLCKTAYDERLAKPHSLSGVGLVDVDGDTILIRGSEV